MPESLYSFIRCVHHKHNSYNLGELAVRPSSPYDTTSNDTKLKSQDLVGELRCLTFPSLASPLVLAYACRDTHAYNEKLGLAHFEGDRLAWRRLLTGVLDFHHQDDTIDLRVDPQGTRYVDVVIGRHPCKVPNVKWNLNG